MRKKIIMISFALIILFIGPLLAKETKTAITEKSPLIKVDFGTLSIGGIFQTWGQFQRQGSTDTLTMDMQRAILLLDGSILTDKINYFMNVDFANFTDQAANHILNDVELSFSYIPYTEITIGKFIPNFTIFGPRLESNLVAIQYPLINQQKDLGRQVGIQTSTKIEGVDFNLGVFNGDEDSFTDTNIYKDYFVRVQYHLPLDFLTDNYIGTQFWHGFPNIAGSLGRYHRVGAFLFARLDDLTLTFEYLAAFDDELGAITGAKERNKTQGGYLHLDYQFCKFFQGLIRVDVWDYDMTIDDNNVYWFTGGGNFLIYKKWASVGINYTYIFDQTDQESQNILAQAQINF